MKPKSATKSSGVNVHIPSPSRSSDSTDVSYDSDHQVLGSHQLKKVSSY